MRKPIFLSLPFPLKGLDESSAVQAQPPNTCRDCLNVRPFDQTTGRARGGQRGGLVKFNTSQVSGTTRIQDINQVTAFTTASATPGALAIRNVYGVAVADGDVAMITPTTITLATSGTNALDANAPVIFSAESAGVVYFADGVNYKKWTAATNTVAAWSASAGTIPAVGADKPRGIELWRGRIVLFGIKTDSQNWFMSAKDDPTDWNYAPADPSEAQAVAGNNSPAGYVGEPLMAVVPYSDDLLIMGSDHSIWIMEGDPMAGGRLVRVSGVTGMAWGRPWCTDPNGMVYFFGSRGGVYRMKPGNSPERITARRLDRRFSNVDLSQFIIRMAWDDRLIGVRLWITPLADQVADHYFFDARTDSWWRDRYANQYHSPVAVHVFDGDAFDDRQVLIGGKDGYIRYETDSALSDDGTAIESQLLMGPIQVPDEKGAMTPFVLAELQATLGYGSDAVGYEVHVGDSAEEVFSTPDIDYGSVLSESGGFIVLQDGSGMLKMEPSFAYVADQAGSFSPVTSVAVQPRLRAYAAYVRLTHSTLSQTWSMEELQAKLAVVVSSTKRRF